MLANDKNYLANTLNHFFFEFPTRKKTYDTFTNFREKNGSCEKGDEITRYDGSYEKEISTPSWVKIQTCNIWTIHQTEKSNVYARRLVNSSIYKKTRIWGMQSWERDPGVR